MIANEGELKDALRRLAASSAQHAPGRIEQKLLEEFRKRVIRRRLVWTFALSAAAIAAVIVGVFLIVPPQPGPPQPRIAHAVPPPIVETPPVPVIAHAPRRARKAQPPREPLEVSTTFYAVPDAESLPPVEDTTMIRVRLPRSAMRMVGLPVNEERAGEHIQADIVLGQDGLMRAVRFVQ